MRHSFWVLPLTLAVVGCSSSESVDDIAPGDDTSASGDTALPDTFVAKDSAVDSSADVTVDDTAKTDTADAATDGGVDGKSDVATDVADATDVATDVASDTTTDTATDAGTDTRADATTDADAAGDSVLADVLFDVASGGVCTLDSECVSGLKCCAGGAVGLPKHCTAPTSGGTCPLVP